jgi:serine/threonine protein kinase
MVSFTKKTGICATLQTLELMVHILGKVNATLSGKEKHAMLMMKVDGKDGSNAILGNKSKSVKPIEGYDTEISVGNEKYYCVTDPKISLDIAFQKIFALRGLHDVGLVYGDVKIENVMIQKENDKYTVRLIDMGSITRKGSANFTSTKSTAAPEGFVGDKQNKKYRTNPKFDVFANAVDLPYIFFGEVAKKHLQKRYELKESPSGKIMASFNRIKNKASHLEKWDWLKTLFMFIFKKKEYEEYKKLNSIFEKRGRFKDRFFLGDIFSAYEYADDRDVEETLREYEHNGFTKPNFSFPNFPENMTNAQKMRYMHWHLGFLKTNRDFFREEKEYISG